MSNEIPLVSELTGDTYKNSAVSEIAVIKIDKDVLTTSKEMAKTFGVGIPAVNKNLKRFLIMAS